MVAPKCEFQILTAVTNVNKTAKPYSVHSFVLKTCDVHSKRKTVILDRSFNSQLQLVQCGHGHQLNLGANKKNN